VFMTIGGHACMTSVRAEAMNGGCTAVKGICCEEALLSLNGAVKTH
jgi:hypothetical protein